MIEDFLNITALCAPSILISKPKFHFLVHLPLYIRCFGPAIIFSTEHYESYNHVFRLTCIHSTRLGPSQDSCRRFAHLDIVKHVISGGFWHEPSLQKWVQAGPAVLTFLETYPDYAKLLGIKAADDDELQRASGGSLNIYPKMAADIPLQPALARFFISLHLMELKLSFPELCIGQKLRAPQSDPLCTSHQTTPQCSIKGKHLLPTTGTS